MEREIMLGVIGAMESEVETLIAALEEDRAEKIGLTVYHAGKLDGRAVVIARSGVGKVNAALAAAEMIRRFGVSAIVNTGVAGALDPTLEPCDAVIAVDLVQHDMDTTPLGDPPGFVSGLGIVRFQADPTLSGSAKRAADSLGIRVILGTVASGDQFIADPERKKRIVNAFGAAACEMEGAAVAHACTLYGVPFAVIRSISDKADGSSTLDFPTFAAKAAASNAAIVRRMIQER